MPSHLSISKDKFFPKKRLGQHVLINPHAKERMLLACDLHPEETILEIGSGTGVLTRAIAEKVRNVIAIEIDPAANLEFKKQPIPDNVLLLNNDFLKYDFQEVPPGTKVIGNLPYNISTPIIERLLNHRHLFSTLFLTVQLEFAQRLAAKVGTKDYGALTCFVQFYCDVKLLFTITPSCFRPAPKVNSGFVKLAINEPLYDIPDKAQLFDLIRISFQQRRKRAINALSAAFAKDQVGEVFSLLQLDPNLRSEDLSLADFVKILRMMEKMKLLKKDGALQRN